MAARTVKPVRPVRWLQSIVAAAMLSTLVLGLVGWLSFVFTGSVPQPVVALGCYAIVTVELGSRMLGRLHRLRLL